MLEKRCKRASTRRGFSPRHSLSFTRICAPHDRPPSRHKSGHSPIQRTISYSERRVTPSGRTTQARPSWPLLAVGGDDRVVWDVGDDQIASCNWVLITTSDRLPPLVAAPPSTAGDAGVDQAVLPSPGPVSPLALLPLARAFPSRSVTSGPTGPSASLPSSRAALIASVSRLSAAP